MMTPNGKATLSFAIAALMLCSWMARYSVVPVGPVGSNPAGSAAFAIVDRFSGAIYACYGTNCLRAEMSNQ